MQSIHCINTIKKDLERIIHPFLPKNSIQPLAFLAFFFTFAPSEIENYCCPVKLFQTK